MEKIRNESDAGGRQKTDVHRKVEGGNDEPGKGQSLFWTRVKQNCMHRSQKRLVWLCHRIKEGLSMRFSRERVRKGWIFPICERKM